MRLTCRRLSKTLSTADVWRRIVEREYPHWTRGILSVRSRPEAIDWKREYAYLQASLCRSNITRHFSPRKSATETQRVLSRRRSRLHHAPCSTTACEQRRLVRRQGRAVNDAGVPRRHASAPHYRQCHSTTANTTSSSSSTHDATPTSAPSGLFRCAASLPSHSCVGFCPSR